MRVAPVDDDVRLAKKWADLYRSRGWNVLPSDPAKGHPPFPYRDLWDAPAPAGLFDRFPLPSVQVMTGRRWRLMVIDLDGPEAPAVWAGWGRTPRTWVTHSGGGGRHLWFTLPAGLVAPMPKAILWRGDGEHSAIERLCDLSLAMAPPSLHRKTGRRYRFVDRAHSPVSLPLPAPCPAWVLALRPIEQRPALAPTPAAPRPAPRTRDRAAGAGRFDRAEVLAAIPDKIGLARSWGVRFDGRPSPAGWHPCHAIGREDRNPSAAVHAETGRYCDLGSGDRLSLFDLAAAMGVFADWRDAVDRLGHAYAPRRAAR